MTVGVAQADVTPDYPVRLSGFGFRRAESEGVTSRIWAKALAFENKTNGPAILITADNLCVPDEITQEIARRLGSKIGLRLERLTITATHTHTAPMLKNVCPTLFGAPIPPEHQANIDRYTQEFIDKLEFVALAAVKDIRPAQISWGIGSANLAVNRRTKGGPVDHDLPVLVVKDLEGKPRAVYFSYACHCVTLSDNKISGDWAGFAQDAVQKHFPGVIALASVGCGADSNPASGVTGANAQVCADQGQQIADEVKRLLGQPLSPLTARPEPRYDRVDVPFDTPRSRTEWEERAKRSDAIGHHARVTLERLNRGEPLPEKLNYPVQSWVFGDQLAMIFLPGETVVDFSLRLKRELDRSRLWVNGYANDGRCYLPSERILKEGGYEGGDAMIYYDMPQRFAPGVENRIINAVRGQIPKSFEAPRGTEGSRPLSPQEALRSFRHKPGLMVELAAAEPLVTAPVAIDWGADGKLWVCEMNDYPAGMDQNFQPGGRVKWLEDADGDGSYDRSVLFLDQLPFPTGVMAWGKGVFVCAAPDILYAEDINGDGKADRVEKVFTGFATDNYQARVNGLTLGLDNWIHGANGLLGGVIQRPPGVLFSSPSLPSVDIRGRDFRFHPATGAFEPASGLTQQGLARDDWGNWFGCDNSRLLLHYSLADHYLRRNPHIAAPNPVRQLNTGPNASLLFPASRLQERFNDPEHANRATSACGLGIYRDTALGAEYFGNAFTCEAVHNLVHRRVVNTDGLAFSSGRAPEESASEFLASTDNWFRPAQARTGPDGALYVADMYRFLIEHPRWIPASRLSQLDVRAGADKGRIYRVRAEKQVLRKIENLTAKSSTELAALLDTPNGAERDRIHTELLARGDISALGPLEQMARAASLPQVRIQALALIEGLGGLTPALLEPALKDGHEQARVNALRLSEKLLASQSSEAARVLEWAAALTRDSSASVRRQAALTLGESADARAGRALAELAVRQANDSDIRDAILSSASPHAAEILSALMQLPEETPGREAWIPPLIATVVGAKNTAALPLALNAILPRDQQAPSATQLAALAAFMDGLERASLSSRSFASARLAETMRQARALAADVSAPEERREPAILLLGRGAEDDLDLLARLLTEGGPERLRRAALSSLRRQKDGATAQRLLARWPQTSPALRGEIISLLLDREEWTSTLLDELKAGRIQPGEISLADRARLKQSSSPQIRESASALLPDKAGGGREEALRKFQPAASLAGNAASGKEVFTRACAACHALHGLGQNVGPDLAVLSGRDSDYLLKNILDPNAVVEPRFINYSVDLKDGRSLSGVIKTETATSLTLASGSGPPETALRSEVQDIRASQLSLMPEGLEEGFNVQEMADLLAFLKSGQAAKKVSGNTPALIEADRDGTLLLPASKAEIYGRSITFEAPFQNLGMWHEEDEHAAWTTEIAKAGAYDVYLDFACAASAAGNQIAISIGSQTITAKVASTGGDWSHYQQQKIGEARLDAGRHRVIVKPQGAVREALIDLRAIALAPVGLKPRWPHAAPVADPVLRNPPAVAQFILDSTQTEAARQAAVLANPQFSAALIQEMTRELQPADEYARIPWIWRVAIACGRRNDAGQMKAALAASLPLENEPLRDWQAVVIGGGIINGLSERGLWPGERIAGILTNDAPLAARWQRALNLASLMTDDQKVPTGTRYDALRMIGLDLWEKRGAQLTRYLPKETNAELQMGAVSGLADMNAPEAARALIQNFSHLTESNAKLALDGLMRSEERIALLLEALEQGKMDKTRLGRERVEQLRAHSSPAVRTKANEVFR